MSDSNLTGALRASLRVVEGEGPSSGLDPSAQSPLREATPDSIDELLRQVNDAFGQGLPESVSDDTLRQLVDLYRAQALKWDQDEAIKRDKPKASRKKNEAITIDLDFDL